MCSTPSDPDLRTEVELAVNVAYEAGEVSRAGIVKQFAGRASPATLYRWIGKALVDLQAGIAIGRTAMAPEEEAAARGMAIAAASVATPFATEAAIPCLARLQDNLARLDAMMKIASKEDGTITNARLALQITREIGVQVSRAERIQATIREQTVEKEFLFGLVKIVLQEPPEIRDRLIAKMQEHNLSYMSRR